MEVIVTKTFKGSPNGYDVIEYPADDKVIDLPDDLAKTALDAKWAKKPKGSKTDAAQQKEAIKSLQAELAALENSLAAAGQDDKPTIDEKIAAKRQELVNLESE